MDNMTTLTGRWSSDQSNLKEIPRLTAFTASMIVEQEWELAGCEPDEDVFIAAAQFLINTGMAWSLQGYFGRTCAALIEAGVCQPAEEI